VTQPTQRGWGFHYEEGNWEMKHKTWNPSKKKEALAMDSTALVLNADPGREFSSSLRKILALVKGRRQGRGESAKVGCSIRSGMKKTARDRFVGTWGFWGWFLANGALGWKVTFVPEKQKVSTRKKPSLNIVSKVLK